MNYDKLTLNELTDEAEQLEEAGNLDSALEFWKAATERKSDPVILCQYGSLAMDLGKLAKAERAFLSAIDSEPDLPNSYNFLGLLYLEQGKFDLARDYLNKSLAIEESARTFTLLGTAQMGLGLTSAARESLDKALEVDAAYEEAYYNLGVTYREERPSKAIEFFQKAIDLDPNYEIAHRELGWSYRFTDQFPEAEYHLRKAIELDESDGWTYIYLGNTLWGEEDLRAAENYFKKSVEVWPDSSIPYWCLALFYEYQDRTREAEMLYKKALQIDLNDVEANLRFGIYLKDIGEYTKAKVYLKRAFSFEPKDERIIAALSSLKRLKAIHSDDGVR
jgi:tetratricopeptide (TPR) repeat protein